MEFARVPTGLTPYVAWPRRRLLQCSHRVAHRGHRQGLQGIQDDRLLCQDASSLVGFIRIENEGGERERGRVTDGVRVTLPVYVRDRAVSAGKDTKFKSIADLRGETIGISRIGR